MNYSSSAFCCSCKVAGETAQKSPASQTAHQRSRWSRKYADSGLRVSKSKVEPHRRTPFNVLTTLHLNIANICQHCKTNLCVLTNQELPSSDANSKWTAKWWSDGLKLCDSYFIRSLPRCGRCLKTLRRLLHPLPAKMWSMLKNSTTLIQFPLR